MMRHEQSLAGRSGTRCDDRGGFWDPGIRPYISDTAASDHAGAQFSHAREMLLRHSSF